MNTFARMLRLDVTLQLRSHLYTATALSTAILCAFILTLPWRPLAPPASAFFVFMDPATIGLSFVGAAVLAEKAAGTLQALAVTPVRPGVYLAAKTVSLSALTLASSLVVAWVATRGRVDPARLVVAATLSSSVAVLIGLWCVARAPGMTALVVELLWVTTLLYAPLIARFASVPVVLEAPLVAVPSYAMLVLLEWATDPGARMTARELLSVAYLASWIAVGWRAATRSFAATVVAEGR